MIEVSKNVNSNKTKIELDDLVYHEGMNVFGIVSGDVNNYIVIVLDNYQNEIDVMFRKCAVTREYLEEYGFELVNKKGDYKLSLEYI